MNRFSRPARAMKTEEIFGFHFIKLHIVTLIRWLSLTARFFSFLLDALLNVGQSTIFFSYVSNRSAGEDLHLIAQTNLYQFFGFKTLFFFTC